MSINTCNLTGRYRDENNRLSTYNTDKSDPTSDFYCLPIASLARNGFIKEIIDAGKFILKCCFCFKQIKKRLRLHDDVVALHFKLNKKCNLYFKHNVTGNVSRNDSEFLEDKNTFQNLLASDKKLRRVNIYQI